MIFDRVILCQSMLLYGRYRCGVPIRNCCAADISSKKHISDCKVTTFLCITQIFLQNSCGVQKVVVLLQSLPTSGVLPNGVMVALQILVLSVWVRVLVRQQ